MLITPPPDNDFCIGRHPFAHLRLLPRQRTFTFCQQGLGHTTRPATMNFFGRTKTRTPSENVRVLRELIIKLGTTSGGDTRKRVRHVHDLARGDLPCHADNTR